MGWGDANWEVDGPWVVGSGGGGQVDPPGPLWEMGRLPLYFEQVTIYQSRENLAYPLMQGTPCVNDSISLF